MTAPPRADDAAVTAAIVGALGQPATYRAAGGAEAELAAVVEADAAFAAAGAQRAPAARLSATVAAASLPAGAAPGDRLQLAGGEPLRVEHVQPDGLGGARLLLSGP